MIRSRVIRRYEAVLYSGHLELSRRRLESTERNRAYREARRYWRKRISDVEAWLGSCDLRIRVLQIEPPSRPFGRQPVVLDPIR